jgi:Tfp pilus assembly protein PilF
MKALSFFSLSVIVFFICSCNQESSEKSLISNVDDYQKFLDSDENKSLEIAWAEYDFWNKKMIDNPSSVYMSKMSAANSLLFENDGNVDHLHKAYELLMRSIKATGEKSGTLRALAHNCITQHRFRESLNFLKRAEVLGDKKRATDLMFFDVYMELGDYELAKKYLNIVSEQKDFNYHLRLSKWKDYKGNLDAAIENMELALFSAEERNSDALKAWAYSSIADYYGHAGRIQDSYDHYLKALNINPDHAYSLKGIAWIIFSHEKNSAEANRIIDAVIKKHKTPDLYLLKAEIADFEGDNTGKNIFTAQYFDMIQNNNYGVMYNKYNALIYSEDENSLGKALEIAEQEIQNRPCPQSYDLLAWAEYNIGNKKKALDICKEFVDGKTYEPSAQYHLAVIYKANGLNEEAINLKKELQGAVYELGPAMKSKIEDI